MLLPFHSCNGFSMNVRSSDDDIDRREDNAETREAQEEHGKVKHDLARSSFKKEHEKAPSEAKHSLKPHTNMPTRINGGVDHRTRPSSFSNNDSQRYGKQTSSGKRISSINLGYKESLTMNRGGSPQEDRTRASSFSNDGTQGRGQTSSGKRMSSSNFRYKRDRVVSLQEPLPEPSENVQNEFSMEMFLQASNMLKQLRSDNLVLEDALKTAKDGTIYEGIPVADYARYKADFIQEELLGEGNSSSVYRCISKFDHRQYAVKIVDFYVVIGQDGIILPDYVKTLSESLREVRIHAGIDHHPHVVGYRAAWMEQSPKIVDDQTIQNEFAEQLSAGCHVREFKLYIQMDLCSEGTLQGFINEFVQGRSVDITHALTIFLRVAEAVMHLHENNLIHLDLKPDNCFMIAGEVKVGDFGHCRLDKWQGGTTLPHSGPAGGTWSYASPEQLTSSDYSTSADLYSLGMMLLEMCFPMNKVRLLPVEMCHVSIIVLSN